MNYKKTNKPIVIGDRVIIDDKYKGVVVCDYDSWSCLSGYDEWLIRDQLVGGGEFSSGVMIETNDFGLLYYAEEDEEIVFDGTEKGTAEKAEKGTGEKGTE